MNTSRVLRALQRNIQFTEVLPIKQRLDQPNYVRHPLWKTFFEANFTNRTFLFFGKSWITLTAFTAFIWWSRILDPPPEERMDRYWINSPKFRTLSALHNPDKRPGLAISLLTFDLRYFRRFFDHPFALNETKDLLFKIKENHLVTKHKNIQYPYVFRQINKVSTQGTLNVHVYPTVQSLPQFEGLH